MTNISFRDIFTWVLQFILCIFVDRLQKRRRASLFLPLPIQGTGAAPFFTCLMTLRALQPPRRGLHMYTHNNASHMLTLPPLPSRGGGGWRQDERGHGDVEDRGEHVRGGVAGVAVCLHTYMCPYMCMRMCI